MSSDDTDGTVLQGGIVVRKLLDNILSLAFAGYMILLIYFLFFSEEYGRTVHYTEYQYNLKVFHEISHLLRRFCFFTVPIIAVSPARGLSFGLHLAGET